MSLVELFRRRPGKPFEYEAANGILPQSVNDRLMAEHGVGAYASGRPKREEYRQETARDLNATLLHRALRGKRTLQINPTADSVRHVQSNSARHRLSTLRAPKPRWSGSIEC